MARERREGRIVYSVTHMSSESSIFIVIATTLAYFVLAVGVGVVLLFPRASLGALRGLGRVLANGFAALGGRVSQAGHEVVDLGERSRRDAAYWLALARQHRVLLTVAGVAVITPAVVALALHRYVGIGGYEESIQPTDPVILSLLQGEQLVPPAPLPPEVFTTREVELLRPALGSASRDWNLLDAEFRQRLLAVFQVMRQYGYEVALLEGYRSPERQDYLAGLGGNVTNAGAFQSYHQFGLAADCAFFLNGRIIIDEKDPWAMRGYKLYGEAAEAAGLTWGGRWKMMDFGHVELHRSGVLAKGR
jgi:peptidoglycan L-alanyl-D-glutamate endopeptidase CwlK